MKKLHKNTYVHTTSDGLNVGCVVDEDGAVSIDLPLDVHEALQWRVQVQSLTPKPLRVIIFTAADRVNSEALKALAPSLGPFSLPSIIQEAGFTQLYTALEAAQPRMLEPLSPVQLRERAVLPDMTFSDSATFTLGMANPVRVDVHAVAGITPGSSMVTVRDTGVVFAGWLVAGREPPLLPGIDISVWLAALSALRRNRKIKAIIPANGPVGDLRLVARTQEYLKLANGAMKKLLRSHKSRDSIGGLAEELLHAFEQSAGPVTDDDHASRREAVLQRLKTNFERIYDEQTIQAIVEPVAG